MVSSARIEMMASVFMAKSWFWIVAKNVCVWRILRTVRGKIVADRGFAKPCESHDAQFRRKHAAESPPRARGLEPLYEYAAQNACEAYRQHPFINTGRYLVTSLVRRLHCVRAAEKPPRAAGLQA